uniref:Uncharacterized protein n=1 Tax=Cannabis sativa TaxID=3483 RepID=A0A803QS56_CANSA
MISLLCLRFPHACSFSSDLRLDNVFIFSSYLRVVIISAFLSNDGWREVLPQSDQLVVIKAKLHALKVVRESKHFVLFVCKGTARLKLVIPINGAKLLTVIPDYRHVVPGYRLLESGCSVPLVGSSNLP